MESVKQCPYFGEVVLLANCMVLTRATFLLTAKAVEKFLMALEVNPKKHEALWCLGNAYTSQGFLYAEAKKAQEHFDQAAECFQKALAEDPTSEVYKKALEMTAKAPALHMELQRQLSQQSALQQISTANEAPTASASGKGAEGGSDFYYDLAGWGILGLITVGWIFMSRSQTK